MAKIRRIVPKYDRGKTRTYAQAHRQTDKHAHHNTPLPYRGRCNDSSMNTDSFVRLNYWRGRRLAHGTQANCINYTVGLCYYIIQYNMSNNNCTVTLKNLQSLPARRYAIAVCVSVCLSVCLSQVDVRSKRLNDRFGTNSPRLVSEGNL